LLPLARRKAYANLKRINTLRFKVPVATLKIFLYVGFKNPTLFIPTGGNDRCITAIFGILGNLLQCSENGKSKNLKKLIGLDSVY
jgi:hypothetical protein